MTSEINAAPAEKNVFEARERVAQCRYHSRQLRFVSQGRRRLC
jgi:hypothetical protein